MSDIKLAEVFEKWASDFVDMNKFDGGIEKVQVNLTAEEIETLIYCMELHCVHTPEMVRLARLLNKAQMSLGHESLKQTYDVVKGIPRED
jgi:hypothetical protein|tara:strand:+ start:483 stop:752 length:270 start_codon:yes stop_codon:yes gene_type:complete